MKYIEELQAEFRNAFGDDFKLEQVNNDTCQIIDTCDRIWKSDLDLRKEEDCNFVKAVANHNDFFLSLYGFLYNYHSIFKDAKNEYVDVIDHKLAHTSLFSSEKVKELQLEQHLCSVLNGYSYAGLILVESTSTVNIDLFSELLEQLAGNYRYAFMNIRNIRGNRSLNFLPYNLKLIYGGFDEGKVKLSDNVIYNCKRVFGSKLFGRQAFLTGKNNGYNNYFKLRAPWFQFVSNENDLKSLEQDTKNVKTKTIRISNKSINKRFVNKFLNVIDDKTIHNFNEGITIFSDEIASYLLNNVDYPAD